MDINSKMSRIKTELYNTNLKTIVVNSPMTMAITKKMVLFFSLCVDAE